MRLQDLIKVPSAIHREAASWPNGRIQRLLLRFFRKAGTLENPGKEVRQLIGEWGTLARLARAYATGKYRSVGWQTVAAILAGLIYFVNPAEVVPDIIPVTGLADDFAVMMAIYRSLQKEAEKFAGWEAAHTT